MLLLELFADVVVDIDFDIVEAVVEEDVVEVEVACYCCSFCSCC